ncbi:MAG: hypothetical protein COA97_11185 [Flavobacteriales bacterium]|nr:MAG: hypothetical protein COA97_11185 [Flavobacteriales bacterium]
MKKITLLFSLMVIIIANSYSQYNTYYVGHSGFGFSQFNLVGAMVEGLAIDAGINTYDYGDQIIGGSCLSQQWENHLTTSTGDSWVDIPGGNGSGQYDILITTELIPITEALDPNASAWGCNLTPYTALDNYHDLAVTANPNTTIYMMEFHNECDFTIGTPTAAYNNWANLNTTNRLLWEQVADSVMNLNPGGAPICIIPVAAATQALADSIFAGSFPGISNFIDIFEPTDGLTWKIHNTDITAYLTACVHFSSIFQQSPIGLTNELLGLTVVAGTAPTNAQALIMQQIAWNTVSNDPRNCFLITEVEENVKSKNDWNTYPNPTTGDFNTPDFSSQSDATIQIFDVFGKLVKEMNQIESNSTYHLKLSEGIYNITITTNSEILFSTKLVIIK